MLCCMIIVSKTEYYNLLNSSNMIEKISFDLMNNILENLYFYTLKKFCGLNIRDIIKDKIKFIKLFRTFLTCSSSVFNTFLT